jgi:hypothetical protein
MAHQEGGKPPRDALHGIGADGKISVRRVHNTLPEFPQQRRHRRISNASCSVRDAPDGVFLIQIDYLVGIALEINGLRPVWATRQSQCGRAIGGQHNAVVNADQDAYAHTRIETLT